MAIAYRSHTLAYGLTATTSVVKPAGVVAGDVLVASFAVSGTGGFTVTPPTGWAERNGLSSMVVFTRTAGATEPASYDFTVSAPGSITSNNATVICAAYSGASRVRGAQVDTAANVSLAFPTVSTVAVDDKVIRVANAFQGVSTNVSAITPTTGNNFTTRVARGFGDFNEPWLTDEDGPAAPGSPTSRTFDPGGSAAVRVATIVLGTNVAPNAPILDVPASLDRNVTNRFNLTPSDPDPGDTTSQTDWRYRKIGAPTWTTVSKISPNTFYDFAAGTFLGTDYEIQARTYDALGEVGPWSSSSFFTANDAPDQPTWTDPLNGQTISTASYTGTISAPDVDESEWRLVADNAGVIDEATVLHGPVLKTTGDVRSHTFTGLTNGVTVWWQARTKFGGLWSQWAAVRTPVAYTPPPAPTVTPAASNADGAVSVTVSTPAPGAGEPTVTHVDLYVRDTTGRDTYRPAAGIRWAMFRVPNGVTVDWLAASGINYEYQAVAHGDNGTTAASAWTAIDPDAVPSIYYGGGY